MKYSEKARTDYVPPLTAVIDARMEGFLLTSGPGEELINEDEDLG